MADIGEHIKFPVRYDDQIEWWCDVDGNRIGELNMDNYSVGGRLLVGPFVAEAINEKHQRDMAGTICANCGLPGEAPWKPCKDGFDHQWKAVEEL